MISIMISFFVSMIISIIVKALSPTLSFIAGWVAPCYIITFVLLGFFICYLVADCYKRFKD